MNDLDMLRRRINVTVNAVAVGDQIEVGGPKPNKRRSVPFPASLAVRAGANVEAMQRMLGHVSAAMALDVHVGLFDDDLC